MAKRTLTTANSSLAMQVAGLYPVPQILAGYSTDDSFATDDVSPAEVQMGVDGRMSAGFVPYPTVMHITLQADSESNDLFDNILGAQVAAREVYRINMTARIQGTGENFALTNGVLTSASPMASSKKVLQARKYTITFESCTKAPV